MALPRLGLHVLRHADRDATWSTATAASQLGTPPYPHEIFDIPYTSVSAFVLLMSSLTMVLALAAIQRGDHRGLRIWLLGDRAARARSSSAASSSSSPPSTTKGSALGSNLFGSTFFMLTGFHGAHVTIGVVWLLSLLFVSLRGGLAARSSPDRRDRRVCTGTSSISSGSSSSRSSTWSRTQTDRRAPPRRRQQHSCGS